MPLILFVVAILWAMAWFIFSVYAFFNGGTIGGPDYYDCSLYANPYSSEESLRAKNAAIITSKEEHLKMLQLDSEIEKLSK